MKKIVLILLLILLYLAICNGGKQISIKEKYVTVKTSNSFTNDNYYRNDYDNISGKGNNVLVNGSIGILKKYLIPPKLIYPGHSNNVETISSLMPEFKWHAAKNVNGYVMYIYKKINENTYQNIFNSIFYAVIPDTTFKMLDGILFYNEEYQWIVKSYNKGKWSQESKPLYFKINRRKPIKVPQLVSPGEPGNYITINSLKPLFTWHKIGNADGYKFKLEELKGNNFKKYYSKININKSDTLIKIHNKLIKKNHKYRWQVQAFNDTDTSKYSKYFYFKTSPIHGTVSKKKEVKNEYEEIYLSFKYSDIISTTITALYKDGKVYLPFQELFDILKIYNKYDKAGAKIEGYYLSNEDEYKIDLNKLEFKSFKNKFTFNQNNVIKTNSDIYFLPSLFKDGFNLNFIVDLSELVLTLRTNASLPVYKKFVNEQNYNAFNSYENIVEKSQQHFGLNKQLFNAGYLDYFYSTNLNIGAKPFNDYRVGIGGEILGGDGQFNISGNTFGGKLVNNRIEWQWRYILQNKYLNQIKAGNFYFDGLTSYNIRGIHLTNDPIEPRKKYSKFTFFDRVGPNWYIELYKNNKLINITRSNAEGYYKFQIPLNYGMTLLNLKFYGPNGENSTSEKLVQIPYTLLPPKEVSYHVNAGELISTKEKVVQADAAVGFNNWLTGKVGLDYLNDNTYKKGIVYSSLSVRLSDSYLFDLLAAPNAYFRFSASGVFYSLSSFNVNYTEYAANQLYNPAKIKREISTNAFIPFNLQEIPANFLFSSQYLKFDNTERYNFNVGFNGIIGGFSPTLNYEYFRTHQFRGGILRSIISAGFNYSIPQLSNLFNYLKGNIVSFRLNYNAENNNLENLNITFATSIFNNTRFQISHSRNFINSFSNTYAQLIIDFPFTRSGTSFSNRQFTQYFQGSVNYDKNYNEFHYYNRNQINRSGVSIRLFFDENGNEKYDKGEEVIKDVKLKMNILSKISYDKNGNILLHELNPYTLYTAKIIESSIKNPLMIPLYDKFSFVTDPNNFKKIEIPFYSAGEVSGSVKRNINKTVEIVPGIKVHIKNLSNDNDKIVSTFTDGSYYHYGLLPGKYKVYLEKSDLKKLKLKSYPESYDIEIKSTTDGDDINNLNFSLK